MTIHSFKSAAGFALVLATTFAQATTIDFDSLKHPVKNTYAGNGLTYSEQGYTFTAGKADDNDGLLVWSKQSGFDADPKGATLTENYFDTTMTVDQSAGDAFMLTSFDLADGANVGARDKIAFTYTDATGLHQETLRLDKKVGLQTFDLDLDGVTAFTLTDMTKDSTFQLDNVVVSAETSASSVPEPGSLGLMAAGLAMVGVVARRRRV